MSQSGLGFVLLLALGCGSASPQHDDVSPTLEASCVPCHARGAIGSLREAVAALPPDAFDSTTFPASQFPVGVRAYTTEDLAEEPYIESGMPTEQAWILHELNGLGELLDEEVSPDFSTEASLNAFTRFTGGGYTEGCELLAKLEQGRTEEPDGMPPPWAPALMTRLARENFAEPTSTERDLLQAYVEGVLGPDSECPGE